MRLINPRPGDPEPLDTDQAVMFITVPAPLAPVHPLRRTRCRICGTLIGGQRVRIVSVAYVTEQECSCGTLPVWAWVICTAHSVADPASVGRDCYMAAQAVHDGEPC